MADDLTKTLTGALATPNSLDQQTKGRSFFLDEHGGAIPSEGNMLTLLTMRDLFNDPGADESTKAAIKNVAKEESRYLIHAMKILSTNPDGFNGSQAHKRTLIRLQDKFGKDMNGSTQLSHLLKTENTNLEFSNSIKDFLGGNTRGANLLGSGIGALRPVDLGFQG